MKNRLAIALIFLLVFLAGAVTGWVLRPQAPPPAETKNMIEQGGRKLWTSGTAPQRAEKFLAEFDNALELTPEQRDGIRAIIEPTMQKYIRFEREHLRLRKIAHDEAVTAIRPLLDPEQQEKLDSLDRSSQQRFQRAFKNIGPVE